MSKVGNKSISLPQGVDVLLEENVVTIKGEKGSSSLTIKHAFISLDFTKSSIIVHCKSKKKYTKKFHGLYRSLIHNMVIGVSKRFEKAILLEGVGYKASLKDKKLILSLGFSHTVSKQIPENLDIELINQDKGVKINGIDKQSVGLFAAQIRRLRPPEPYLGKGVRYLGEVIKNKIGKSNSK